MLDWDHQNENNFNSYCSSKVSDPMTTLTTLTFSHCQLPRIQHSFSLKRKVQDNSINIYWTLTTCKRLPKYCKDGDTNSWAGNRTVSSLLPRVYWKISLSGNDLETDTHIVFSDAETRMVLWSLYIMHVKKHVHKRRQSKYLAFRGIR